MKHFPSWTSKIFSEQIGSNWLGLLESFPPWFHVALLMPSALPVKSGSCFFWRPETNTYLPDKMTARTMESHEYKMIPVPCAILCNPLLTAVGTRLKARRSGTINARLVRWQYRPNDVLSYVCSHMCALIRVLSYVWSHMDALIWVLSYVSAHTGALICAVSYGCSHLGALICVLSRSCSYMYAFICVISHVYFHVYALTCGFSYVCSHMCNLISFCKSLALVFSRFLFTLFGIIFAVTGRTDLLTLPQNGWSISLMPVPVKHC